MALNPPSNVTATSVSQTAIRIAWTNPAQPIDTVIVWRSDSADGPWQSIADVAGTSFIDDGLPVATTFFYRLMSQRRSRYSDFSAIVSATTGALLPAVIESDAAPGPLFSRENIAFGNGLEVFIYQSGITKQLRIGTTDTPFSLLYNGHLSTAFDAGHNKFVTLSIEPNAAAFSQLVVFNGPTFKFGDSNTRPQGLVKLKSGGFAGAFAQIGSPVIGLVYLSPNGIFSTKTVSINNEKSVFSCQSTIAQHPVDGAVWGFVSRDSTGLIRSIRAHESGDELIIDSTQLEFLGHLDNNLLDDFSPNGENPHMEAFADSSRGVIQLAYQSNHQKIFSTSPFIKGAWICIAAVRSDGSKIFSLYQNWVERISHFGLIANPKGVYLAVNPIDEPTLTFPKTQIVSMPSQAVIYTRTATRPVSSLSGVDWLTDNEPTTIRIALT